MKNNLEEERQKLDEMIEKMGKTFHKRNKWLRSLNKLERSWLETRRSTSLFVIVEKDLTTSNRFNKILLICRTEEIAQRAKKEIEEARSQGEQIVDSVCNEIYEINYLDQ